MSFDAGWRARGRRRSWRARRPPRRWPTLTEPSWSPRTSSSKNDATFFAVSHTHAYQCRSLSSAVVPLQKGDISQNKAVIDHSLRPPPRCCQLGSYCKRPKSSPVRSFACNWYYCAQFIAKPKAACALRGNIEQPWLMSKYDVIHKTGST